MSTTHPPKPGIFAPATLQPARHPEGAIGRQVAPRAPMPNSLPRLSPAVPAASLPLGRVPWAALYRLTLALTLVALQGLTVLAQRGAPAVSLALGQTELTALSSATTSFNPIPESPPPGGGVRYPMGEAPTGIHHTPGMVAEWRRRALEGPYRVANDRFPGSPGDWARIIRHAEGFRRDPFSTRATGQGALALPAQIWAGSAIPGEGYPVYEGIGLMSAAFASMVFADSAPMAALAPLCVAVLRVQLRQPGITVGGWPLTTNYEHGAKEALWLIRLIYTADYLGPRLPAGLRDSLTSLVTGAADYYVTRLNQGPIGQCFPARGQGDYARRGRDARPDAKTGPAFKRSDKYPGGRMLTHVDSLGRPGNVIPVIAGHYNNRVAEKMSLVGLAGVWAGRPRLVAEARRFSSEWLRYGVFADGTLAEYDRNGDYQNPGQGMWYGALIMQQYLLLAQALWIRGDSSMLAEGTREGLFGTEASAPLTAPLAGGAGTGPLLAGPPPAKSIRRVLDRYADNCTGRRPIYYLAPEPALRIDNHSEVTGRHAPWDMLLAVCQPYWGRPYDIEVYERRAPGAMPMPVTKLGTAAKVDFPWGGTGAELPGLLFMFGAR